MSASQLGRTAAFAALLTLVLLGFEQCAVGDLRRAELARLDASLERAARAVRAELAGRPVEEASAETLDAIADRAAAAAGVRVSLIAADGALLADSEVVSLGHLPDIENHAGREEVRAALAGGVGRASRTSSTVGRRLRYLAVPLEGGGVVRAAADLEALEAAVARARIHALGLAAAAVLGGVALLHLFLWLTHRRPLRDLRRMAVSIAEGRLDARMPRPSDPDLSRIARSINAIAGQLRQRLVEVTRDKEQLGAVLEGMVEGVLVVDARGRVLLANSRLRELFDTTGEIVGRPLLEGVRNADLEQVLEEASRTGETVARTLTLSGPSVRRLQVQAARFPKEGEPVGTVAVLHDVTELVRLEEVRRDFVANASHELRTPLAAIRGFAETLLDGAALSPEDQRSYVEVIDRHAERLSNIVEDLLELSTIESRTLKLEMDRVDVSELARNLIADSQLRLEERRIRASLDTAGDPVAWADARALDQVMGNLLDNALKYTEPGGSIDVRVEARPTRVRVSVRDSGIGIPRSDLGRIFERFYRVDKARSRALGGTGLGLSIVKHLVQAMGGEIHVESELGRGSTFVFTVPATREASPPPEEKAGSARPPRPTVTKGAVQD